MTYDYENLQYGTIYCTAPLPEEIMKEIPSFYNIEYIEKQNDENIIFARCINIGCINNPYAIVSYTFGENEEKFRNFKRFAKRLGDFLDFSFYGQEYSSYGGRPRISGTDSTHNDEKDDNESEGVEISILGEECDEPKFCPVDAKIEQERNEILNRISIFLEEYLKKHNKMPNITEIKDATETQQILLGIPDNPMTSPEGTTLYSLTPSPVLVDKDMRIMLEDWGYELKLPPQHKVLYIFFLKHTNGIRLKDIKKYINEIKNIYSIISPMKNDEVVDRFTDAIMTDEKNKRIIETISKINSQIQKYILNEDINRFYCIDGERGKKYGIANHIKRTIPEIFGKVED